MLVKFNKVFDIVNYFLAKMNRCGLRHCERRVLSVGDGVPIIHVLAQRLNEQRRNALLGKALKG